MSRLLTKLRASLHGLSPVLQRVARYVLDNPDAVIYHSVTELAEATRSSEGSIIRFCQDLGFSGFQELKLTLAVELDPPGRKSAPPPTPGDHDFGGLMARLVEQAAAAAHETANLYEGEVTAEVAERLRAAERVDIYGVGASGVVAQYFAYKLLRLGLTAQAFTDLHLGSMSASNLSDRSVAIGVSSSGSTLDTLQALKAAKEAGAFTVAITNRLKSPLAKVADRSLFASPPESPLTGGDVFAKIGQLLLLEALARLMIEGNAELSESVRRTAHVVADRSM
ncbi:MAG: MurR/RpiR family transcriptional regulator [Trueperaceae bacterium]|nr:MurR/RpiR family transcriptional regulator [Trueperaceae bacterium]